ncbi:MAG: PTS transporter subunit EIIC [Enterocloster clostridioformis]
MPISTNSGLPAEGGIKGVTGMYQAGFFPVMMFGLPAAAFAMYQTAKPEKKQYAAGILIAGAVGILRIRRYRASEFSFMFLAPGLYLVHAVLTGISVAVAARIPLTAGSCFSAGVLRTSFSAAGCQWPTSRSCC